MSLFGGGSDYPSFIQSNRYGYCIGFAIDSYAYVNVKQLSPDSPTRVTYSEIEEVWYNGDIRHRAIRTALQFMDMLRCPLEINYIADLPNGCGLGTSSSMLVSLLGALQYLRGYTYRVDHLMIDAFRIEDVYTEGNIGYQDHSFASLGNIQELTFDDFGVEYHTFSEKTKQIIENNGLLFMLPGGRNSSAVVSKYIGSLADSSEQLRIREVAQEAAREMRGGCDLDILAELLRESWRLKRAISPHISTERIDWLLDLAKQNGALAGKLCGGGGGGSIFLLAEPNTHAKLIQFFVNESCTHIPFKIPYGGVERVLPR